MTTNGVRFTDREGRVDVEARRLPDEARDWLELRIRHTCVGIRSEDVSRLFAEFEHLDSGVGRATTPKIVEFQGGGIGI